MTDPQQAARIAAMRARRGQAPADIPVATTPMASTTQWAAPSVTPATGAAADTAAHAASIAALEAKVNQLQRQVQSSTAAAPKGKHPHVAAGARILATGLTASAVFGLTSVLAQANPPSADVTPPASTVIPTVPPAAGATVPGTTLPGTTLPGSTVPATTLPGTVPSTVVLTLPPKAAPSKAAAPAPKAATPAAKPTTKNTAAPKP
jgi:hypothetical protein